MLLQQIHYWLQVAGKERDGRLWIYNSYTAWTQQMPFWSKSKVWRVVTRLRALGLIEVANYNARPMIPPFGIPLTMKRWRRCSRQAR